MAGPFDAGFIGHLRDLKTFFGTTFKIKALPTASENGRPKAGDFDGDEEELEEEAKVVEEPEAYILSCVGTGFTNTAKKTYAPSRCSITPTDLLCHPVVNLLIMQCILLDSHNSPATRLPGSGSRYLAAQGAGHRRSLQHTSRIPSLQSCSTSESEGRPNDRSGHSAQVLVDELSDRVRQREVRHHRVSARGGRENRLSNSSDEATSIRKGEQTASQT